MTDTAPRATTIALPGRAIQLLEWGRKRDSVVVLVHGIRDHAYSWDPIARALARDHHVLALDLRGHGDSDWCDAYNLHDYLRDLAAVVERLGLPRFALVGHSLGGHIALRYAACFPERLHSLCSIEGVEMPIMRDQRRAPRLYPQRLREWLDKESEREKRQLRVYASHEQAIERMALEHPTIDAQTLGLIVRHGMKPAEGGLVWKYDNACRNRAPEDAHGRDVDELLGAITCPTLLAYGLDSWIPIPPPERLARLAHHQLVTFPKAGHWLHHEARENFLAALQAFLAETRNLFHKESSDHA
jgi:pimeloyl-ACP methyl ester carboxylesterase